MKLATYKLIAKQIDDDVTAAFAKHGLLVHKTRVGVNEEGGSVKYSIELRDHTAAAAGISPERALWRSSAQFLDLDPAWLGQKVPNSKFTVGGLFSRGEKCVQLLCEGKSYKTSPERLRASFGVKPGTPIGVGNFAAPFQLVTK